MNHEYIKSKTDAVKQLPQSQASIDDQLWAMVFVAEKLGLYDAADFLKILQKDHEKRTGKNR